MDKILAVVGGVLVLLAFLWGGAYPTPEDLALARPFFWGGVIISYVALGWGLLRLFRRGR